MGASPITPQEPDLDGQVVQTYIALTSTGATTVETINLNTYDHLIDIRVGHPVLGGMFIEFETDVTGSEIITKSNEMARGTAPDSTAEWQITDANTITFYKTADKNGGVILSYIAFGVQLA